MTNLTPTQEQALEQAIRNALPDDESRTILHLCADTGSDSKPWADAGYNVILVGSDIGVENYHPPQNVYGVIANPPCTEFSIARSGGKARMGDEGVFLVEECQRVIQECNPKFWVIENPATGKLKSLLGEPDYVYQPWWFGSPWTKKTALWGDFNKPKRIFHRWEDVPKNPNLYVRPPTTKHNRSTGKPQMYQLNKNHFDYIPEFQGLPKPKNNMEFRSLCSQGFAKAFYESNKYIGRPLTIADVLVALKKNSWHVSINENGYFGIDDVDRPQFILDKPYDHPDNAEARAWLYSVLVSSSNSNE